MELEKKLSFICNLSQSEFRSLNIKDVSDSYIRGLNAEKNNLVNVPIDVNIKSQQRYISNILQSKENTVCGLFINCELVGTAGIQNISKDCVSSIGIFVFDKKLRGRGYGKTLIWASCALVNACHGIREFSAGMKKTNALSFKSFLSCGFKVIRESEDGYVVQLRFENLQKPPIIERVVIEEKPWQQQK